MVFREGQELQISNEGKDIMAFAAITDVLPFRFAVSDLTRFLGILKLYDSDNFDVDLADKTLTIMDKAKHKFIYTLANEQHIVSPRETTKAGLEEHLKENFQCEFELSTKELMRLRRNMSIANLPDAVIFSDGESVFFKVTDTKSPTAHEYSIPLNVQTSKKFNIILENHKITPLLDEDYKVLVGGLVVKLTAKDVDYYISPDLTSEYS